MGVPRRSPPVRGLQPRRKFEVSHRDALLEAAAELVENFSIHDLIVAAWRRRPDQFGCPGYEQDYPDTHRAAPYIWGACGILRGGRLLLQQNGRYRFLPREPNLAGVPEFYATRLSWARSVNPQAVDRGDVFGFWWNGGKASDIAAVRKRLEQAQTGCILADLDTRLLLNTDDLLRSRFHSLLKSDAPQGRRPRARR